MRQTIIKASSFIVTFIIALYVISTIMNMGNTDMTVEMTPAQYPTMSMMVENNEVNTLFGYTGEMKANYIRDALTILPEDRKLYVKIKLWGSSISGLSYEVRSLDTTRLVENTEVYDYIKQDDEITADFDIKDLIEKNQEYLLVSIIKMDNGEEVRYYTRIIENPELHAREQLDYVLDFHNKTFDKEEAKSLATYLESNEEGDNSTYRHVDIHSSFDQITWGNLNITHVYDLSTKIIDMDQSTASILLKYYVDIDNNSETEKFSVNEFFRIRYTEKRIYLLNYERNMEQIFNPDNEVFINDKIILGITGEDNQLKENTDGDTIAFVTGNTLYEYRNSEGTLARIFSFYDEDNYDIRTLHDEHDIKMLSMDEAGNMTFIVYGYMNRGRHEGEVGVSAFYYDNARNSIEERAFISYDKSYTLLKQDISELAYINRHNVLFLYIDEAVFSVNIDNASTNRIADGVTLEQMVTSASNRMIAWSSTAKSINLMDLSSGKTREIEAGSGEQVHALGFVVEDFVYGLSNSKDVIRDAAGNTIIPMHTVMIEDKDGNPLKEYKPENVYVTDVSIDTNTIQMKRVKKSAETGNYYLIDSDQIMNNSTSDPTKNSVIDVVTDDRETIREIALVGNVPRSIHLQTPKEVMTEGDKNITLESSEHSDKYYVYAKGDIHGTFSEPSKAVSKANEVNGVVVDDGLAYIWQKGSRASRVEITQIEPSAQTDESSSLAACLDVILEYEGTPRNSQYELNKGETAMSLLGGNIDGKVLNLSGCDLQAVLYYVSQMTPVLASVDNENAVLIVGYDEKNTLIMDPQTGSIYKKGMEDSAEMFKNAGNEFIAYVRSAK